MGKFSMTRSSAPKPASPQPIKRFEPPSGPRVRPASPGAPKQADQLKQEDGIDPRQQRY